MRSTLMIALTAALLAGPAHAQQEQPAAPGEKGSLQTFLDPPPSSSVAKIKAGDVLADLHAVNLMMTESATMAAQKGSTKEVTDLARGMIEDHRQLTAQLTQLVAKKKIDAREKTFDTGEIGLGWADRQASQDLAKLSGKRFETAFQASVVSRYRFAMGIIDVGHLTKLDPDVKSYLDSYERVARANFQQAQLLLLGGTPVGAASPAPSTP